MWTNCYHAYPAHAAFGGYKSSGIGRENHQMMLDHYQQTKNLLVSYDPNKLGLLLMTVGAPRDGGTCRDHPGGGGDAPQPPGSARRR